MGVAGLAVTAAGTLSGNGSDGKCGWWRFPVRWCQPNAPRLVEVGSLVMERGHCLEPVISAKGRGSRELKHFLDFRGSRDYGLRCPGSTFCRWWLFSWLFDRG